MKFKIVCCILFASLFIGGSIVNSSNIICNKTKWVQPDNDNSNLPVWGHKNGIRVGIAPTPGPRGLLRIYAPYLGHKYNKTINFIAFEPIVAGDRFRALSELEMSNLDNVRGKRFWSSNDSVCIEVSSVTPPAKGVIKTINGVETLTVYIYSETFDNGAQVYVRLRFSEDNPYEIELTTNATFTSKKLEHFILTATMGNFARLRTLYLSDYKKSSLELWPNYTGSNFTDHDSTSVDNMIKEKYGGVFFIASTNEKNPQKVDYNPHTKEHWKYYGKGATQYWYTPNPNKYMQGLVNGRYTYWASKAPIPGGISFENFELKSPFINGEKFYFGVTPMSPEKLIEKIKSNN